jgi:hypothetical protein
MVEYSQFVQLPAMSVITQIPGALSRETLRVAGLNDPLPPAMLTDRQPKNSGVETSTGTRLCYVTRWR